ncbi:MAG: hypothetical protein HKN68_15645 [Saprospiraceae bacterium]|nr:hypothetical protein [Saprospiraceae bacterium]
MRLALVTLLLLFGCSDSNDTENEPDFYRVKYIVDSSTIHSGGQIDVTIDDPTFWEEELVFNIEYNERLEVTVGTYYRGDSPNLRAVAITDTFNQLYLVAEIYVAKNSRGPFVLKEINESDEPRDSVSLSYTILFD